PPDMAQAFHVGMRAADSYCAGRRSGILALGDSSYTRFCGFGMALEDWLRRWGDALLFDTILVDRGYPSALVACSEQLSRLFQGQLDVATRFNAWTLIDRRISNPSGAGQPCHELHLQPAQDVSLEWRAGDIAEIQIGDSGAQREYSIASTPAEGMLRLLVREHRRPDGSPGLGSGWLGMELARGDKVMLHIRPNPLFRAPEDDCPAIFVGNGTGIAGLRALLQERVE